MSQSTTTSITINATPQQVFAVFMDGNTVALFQAPDGMTGKMHHYDFEEGGSYDMSLYYNDGGIEMKGKTAENEDRFTARFTQIIPDQKIVQAIRFNADDDTGFSGEMTMEISFEEVTGGTQVTYTYHNIPEGIKSEDNEAGTEASLKKLKELVEEKM